MATTIVQIIIEKESHPTMVGGKSLHRFVLAIGEVAMGMRLGSKASSWREAWYLKNAVSHREWNQPATEFSWGQNKYAGAQTLFARSLFFRKSANWRRLKEEPTHLCARLCQTAAQHKSEQHLSIRTGVVVEICKSLKRINNQVISHVQSARALYSAYVDNLETTDNFFDCQEMRHEPRKRRNPVVDLLVVWQLAQSLSQ
ncbi:hypothetical protein Tco_0349427 [Tanacetum coccineum]